VSARVRSEELVVIVAAAVLAAACRDRSPAPMRNVVVWRSLGSWSSRASLQTESFICDTGMLRVRWEARSAGSSDDPGTLKVTLHSAVSGRPLVVAVDNRGPGQDTAYISEDPRDFFLVVEAAHLEWSVVVEEGVRAKATEAVHY